MDADTMIQLASRLAWAASALALAVWGLATLLSEIREARERRGDLTATQRAERQRAALGRVAEGPRSCP